MTSGLGNDNMRGEQGQRGIQILFSVAGLAAQMRWKNWANHRSKVREIEFDGIRVHAVPTSPPQNWK
jgi:hypothetical protein